MRRAKALKLCAQYDNPTKDPESHTILRKIIALAFLPLARIGEGRLQVERSAFDLVTRPAPYNIEETSSYIFEKSG